MVGALAGLTPSQQQLGRSLPLPIAAAWQHLLLATSQRDVAERLPMVWSVVARTLAGLAVCDYLRGRADMAVDAALQDLVNPSPQAWLQLLSGLAQAEQPQPGHVLAALANWLRAARDGEVTGLEQLRYSLAHTAELAAAKSDFSLSTRLSDGVAAMAALLESLAWLGQWRLLQVAALTTERSGGFRGTLRLLAGADPEPAVVVATWSAHLVTDALYLLEPQSQHFLEVSPLISLQPATRKRPACCWIWQCLPTAGELQLGDPEGAAQHSLHLADSSDSSQTRPWLTAGVHALLHEDLRLAEQLPPPPGLTEREPREVRAMPDLSERAFAPVEPAAATPRWSQRLGVGLQSIVVIGLLVATTVALTAKKERPRPPAPAAAPAGPTLAVAPPLPPPRVPPAPAPPARVAAILPAQPTPAAIVAVAAPVAAPRPAPPEVAKHSQPLPPAAPPSPHPQIPPTAELIQQARHDAAVRPSYALLRLLVAKEQRVPGADLALAQVNALANSLVQCRHYVLLALAAQPADPLAHALADQCHADPTAAAHEADDLPNAKDLSLRLYREGYSIIYGARHSPGERRTMAKTMYTLASERGYAKAHTGLAAIYWYGESDKVRCREHAQAALQGGSDAQAQHLLELCK